MTTERSGMSLDETPLGGRWHHGNGYLVCGSFRIARADWEADVCSADNMRERVFDWICESLNAAQAKANGLSRDAVVSEPKLPTVEIVFGKGEVVIHTGRHGGEPCVYLAPAKYPGIVGESSAREGMPLDRMIEGESVLTFPTMEQAYLVADALCNQLASRKVAVPDRHVSDAMRWRYTQQEGYFYTGPFDSEGDFTGFSVGVEKYDDVPSYQSVTGKKQRPLVDCVEGRGKTLAEAIDKAMLASQDEVK